FHGARHVVGLVVEDEVGVGGHPAVGLQQQGRCVDVRDPVTARPEQRGADARARLSPPPPEPFDAAAERDLLATALGATLYCPATRPKLADDLARRAGEGATSMVVCLEDSIPDSALVEGERNAIAQLRQFAETAPDAPLVFVRVRSPQQIPMIVRGLEHGV